MKLYNRSHRRLAKQKKNTMAIKAISFSLAVASLAGAYHYTTAKANAQDNNEEIHNSEEIEFVLLSSEQTQDGEFVLIGSKVDTCNSHQNTNVNNEATVVEDNGNESIIEQDKVDEALNAAEAVVEQPINNLIKEADFSEMTKSEVIQRKNDLQIFIGYFDEFEVSKENNLYISITEQINKCNSAIDNMTYKYPYTYSDLDMLAYIIMREAGSNDIPDEVKMLVGCVVLNRKAHGGINGNLTNPSIADILNEKGQYPYKSSSFNKSIITERCYECARKVLEHEYTCPSNVLFQAQFKQGSGVYYKYYSKTYNNTTYFCYL